MEPNGDSAAYLGLANGLKRGCGLTWWSGNHCSTEPETNRTPGYPVFLALLPGPRTALIAQALLWSLLCFFAALFTARLGGAGAGCCAAVIIAVDIPAIVSSNEIMSETLFTALLIGAVLAELEILRSPGNCAKLYSLLASASAMLGLALLVRPIAVFVIPIAVVAPIFLQRAAPSGRALMVILLAAGPAIGATAWIWRNHSVAGINTFSTIGGLDFFYYRAVGTLAFASHTGWAETLARTRPIPNANLTGEAYRVIIHHPFAFVAMTLWSFFYLCWVPVRDPLARFLGISSALPIQDPGSVRIEALVRKLWNGDFAGLTTTVARQEFDSSVVLMLLIVLQLVMTAFIWAGVMFALRKYGRARWAPCVFFAFAIVILLLLPASGPEAVARLRIPATPLLAFLAGVGWFGSPGESSH
jgi:hypothetical protein